MTLYDVLGVAKDAPPDEITEAYRQLAKAYHPDRNPGDDIAAAHYARVTDAYEVLNDPVRRAEYDRSGETKRRDGEHQQLLSVLVPIMMAVLEDNGPFSAPLKDRDLIASMKTHVRSMLERIETIHGRMRDQEKRLETVAGRFVVNAETEVNLLEQALQAQLAGLRNHIQSCKDDLDRHQRALNYLGTVTYRRDGSFATDPFAAPKPITKKKAKQLAAPETDDA